MFLNTLTIILLLTGELLADGIDDLCHDVVSKYNCNHFVPKRLCGSDGILYQTECDFAKAHCKHRHLTIVSEGGNCGGTGTTAVIGGSENFKRVCEVIVSNFDCSKFQHRVLCGSDGNEYHSECDFTKAHCRNPFLSIVREGGPCHTTVMASTVEKVITTAKPNSIAPSVASTAAGSQPVTNVQTIQSRTTSDQTVSPLHTDKPTSGQTTSNVPTQPPTQDPILCQVLLGASCPSSGPKVCGSDTKTYANVCELEKQRCKTPEVRPMSTDECPTSFNVICRAVLEHPCSGESEPVCGTNSLQYNNLCEFQKAKCVNKDLTMGHSGPCM